MCKDAKVVLDGSGGLQQCWLQPPMAAASAPRAPLLEPSPTPLPAIRGPADQSHPQKPIYSEHERVLKKTWKERVASQRGFHRCPVFQWQATRDLAVALGCRTTTWLLINLQSFGRKLLCHLHEGCDGQRKARLQGYWLGFLKEIQGHDAPMDVESRPGMRAALKQKIRHPLPPPKVRRSRSLGVQNFTKAANC